MPFLPVALLLLDLLLSLIAFALYAWDKAAAKAKRRRVPEKILNAIALVGGWPGALLAQRTLHHKTRKRSFQTAFGVAVTLNVLVTAALLIALTSLRRQGASSVDETPAPHRIG